ncbi:MAG: ABC transporter permease [Verrucomicrobia bacterium]|jgi:oligopeptide transport system permease protein|nr:MAG: ABC transporter permease [Verrucomicrobiota bacterium]
MYFLKRLLVLPPLLILISLIAFLLVRTAPGGPFDKERKPASPEIERRLLERYHLDQPLWKQYLLYLKGLSQGDFGPSLKQRNHTVNDIISQALPVSATLGAAAFLFSLGVGIPLGFYTAARRGHGFELAGSSLALLFVCVPALVVGPVLVIVFAVHWSIFPVALWGGAWHMVLPTITLGLYFSGKVARLMREGMLTTMHADYIIAARAKGLSESAVLWRHAFRIAVLPVVSYSGPLLADLLTGSFVVESLFQIPGMGVFVINSALNRDYPMIVGLVLVYAVLLLVLNLLVDAAYTWLDPRVRYD